jgi:signal transduction histidine kinase
MNLRESLSGVQGAIAWNWQRLGDSAALGPAVAWFYLPLGLLGPVLLEPNRAGGSVGGWLVVGLIGQSAIFATLWISRRLIHRKTASQSRPFANLVAILIAIGLRAVLIAWFAEVLNLTDDFDIAYRLGAGIFTQTGLIVAVAVIVSSFSFHRQLAAKLWSQQEQLRELNSSIQERLGGMRRELAAQVRLTINPLIEEIDRGLDQVATGENPEAIRKAIQEIVDGQLRPLSRSLESQIGNGLVPPASASTPLTTWVPLPSKSPLSLLIRPFSASFFVALLAASPGLIANGIAGAVVYPLVAFLLTAPILLTLRALFGSWKLPVWWGITFVFVVTAVVVGAVRIFAADRILMFPNTSFLITLIGGGLAGTIAATYAIANERRLSIEQDLQSSVDELKVKLSVLQQHEFVTRKELSYILHGSVQSALHVAAMRLASDIEPDANLLSTIRRDIEIATARLETPASVDSLLIDTLSDIVELWDGTCSVKWTLDHQTIRRLVESPVAASCIAEVTRECIGNAIRHGQATELWITITTQADRVTLTSIDNGTVETDWKPGLGSQMMNEMCLSWSHSKEPQGTRVTAEIAIS